jgi:hypothetical protein
MPDGKFDYAGDEDGDDGTRAKRSTYFPKNPKLAQGKGDNNHVGPTGEGIQR